MTWTSTGERARPRLNAGRPHPRKDELDDPNTTSTARYDREAVVSESSTSHASITKPITRADFDKYGDFLIAMLAAKKADAKISGSF